MQKYKIGDVTFSYNDDLYGDVVVLQGSGPRVQGMVQIPVSALAAFQNHCDALLICGADALANHGVLCNQVSKQCTHQKDGSCLIGLGLQKNSVSNF